MNLASKMTIADKKTSGKRTTSWQQAQRSSSNVMTTQLGGCFCAPTTQAIA